MNGKRKFFLVRVGVLLFVLFLVVLYAIHDVRSRRARNDWDAPVDVAIVVVHVAGTEPVEAAALQAFRDRAPALEERLAAEAERTHPGMVHPFRLKVFGPVEADAAAPEPASDGVVDLVKQAWRQHRWLARIDPAAGVVTEQWGSRIYIQVRKPASVKRSFVEGLSQQGGRIGIVAVELDPSMADFTLFVAAHELLHTLGATDKYDANGLALDPTGLAEPLLVPKYPQRFAEVMARNRPLAADREAVPAALSELAIGALTAQEIGWRRP